jgi:hypothetical protein
MSKGQVWSFDFAVSVVIFFSVVVMILFSWNYTTAKHTEQTVFNEMESKAVSLSDSFIRTSGYPEEWNSSNVQIIGMADEENVLNETKILQVVGMPYDTIRATMGIMNYNFYLGIRYLNETVINMNGTDLECGLDPSLYSNSTMIVPIERFMLFDHKVASLLFILWV